MTKPLSSLVQVCAVIISSLGRAIGEYRNGSSPKRWLVFASQLVRRDGGSMKIRNIVIEVTLALVAIISLPFIAVMVSVAEAAPVTIGTGYSVEGLGQFSGTMDYSATSSSTAVLTLTLTNDVGTAAGGIITGVALNLPDASGITGLTTSVAPSDDWLQLGLSENGVPADPFGNFDFGDALGGSWLGGGSPNAGIGIGNSGTFVFNFTGSNLNNLTTLSFINALASGNAAGPAEFMAVRFRGFANDASDKVGGSPVPVPASLWLLASSIGGLGVFSRKRKQA